MTPLTQRDKKLLGFLAIVVVLFIFVRLLIMPQMERYLDLDSEIALAELEQHEMNLKIVSINGARKRNEELKEELKRVSEMYYPMYSSQEIDREVTGIFLDHGVDIENFVITMPSGPSKLEPYLASENEALQQSVVQDQVYAADVVVKCNGTRAQMAELIDFIMKENAAVAVTGYSFETQRAGEVPQVSRTEGSQTEDSQTEGSGGLEQVSMTIGLQLFMCENGEAKLE